MAKEKNRKQGESPLVATLIKEEVGMILVTSNAKYYLDNGGIIRIEKIDDYETEVRGMINKIAERASTGAGVYRDKNILIQIKYGSEPLNLG